MRIGIVSSPWVTVPPQSYGGTEGMVDTLAKGLAVRGHDVRVFTVGSSTIGEAGRQASGSITTASLYAEPVEAMGDSLTEAAHALAAYEELADCDVIHDHTLVGPLLARGSRSPLTVATNHSIIDARTRRLYADVARRMPLIAISERQHANEPDIDVARVIHHGIDLSRFPVGSGEGGYLLFLGRMCAEKGVDVSARVARRTGRRLVIAAKMREPAERAYFERQVRPLLGGSVDFIGEVGEIERVRLLRGARALLNPIQWEEPFGLVMIEALACGTPVIARPHGAAPEIVEDGRTGFLADGEDELVRAVCRVGRLDRRECRVAAEQRFSAERMVADHEDFYRFHLDGRGRPRSVGSRSTTVLAGMSGMTSPTV